MSLCPECHGSGMLDDGDVDPQERGRHMVECECCRGHGHVCAGCEMPLTDGVLCGPCAKDEAEERKYDEAKDEGRLPYVY